MFIILCHTEPAETNRIVR